MDWQSPRNARLQACIGCHEGCTNRSSTGRGNEAQCVEVVFYSFHDLKKNGGKQTDAAYIATDLLQKHGINAYEAMRGLDYLIKLNEMGILGEGKEINCNLPFDQVGEVEFAEKFLEMISHREGIGDDFAEGFARAAAGAQTARGGRLHGPFGGGGGQTAGIVSKTRPKARTRAAGALSGPGQRCRPLLRRSRHVRAAHLLRSLQPGRAGSAGLRFAGNHHELQRCG